MGVIIKNGIQYSGGNNSVVLTQAEYDALSEAEKKNGKIYFISDGKGDNAYTKAEIDALLDAKQDALVSGTNIKTVNGNSLMGAGNLAVGIDFEVGVEKWYGTYTDGGVTYQAYSKILNLGALPSEAGSTGYPHGITNLKQILQINGFTNDGFVMNAPRQNVQDNICIYQTQKAGNVMVEVGKDRSSKNGFVMLIYAKNN